MLNTVLAAEVLPVIMLMAMTAESLRVSALEAVFT